MLSGDNPMAGVGANSIHPLLALTHSLITSNQKEDPALFNPMRLDTDQWVGELKDAGQDGNPHRQASRWILSLANRNK